MAKFEAVIKAELDPHQPVVEVMAVISAMLQNNKGHEGPILLAVYEQVGTTLDRITKQGGRTDAK
ncbi:hypothetical protein [Paenibacillus paeoniae]|uniref:Uncharacterized protein n=1 Tax=Paenibacillus paeoniae TaxID=2292705 RepID=A0A371P1B6_9BACL|nr:hypothetical protein [Paenibacillus paeoniae]REK69350.1 hypothetical protein DX130_24630 [Paenibacillus paeoniae]